MNLHKPFFSLFFAGVAAVGGTLQGADVVLDWNNAALEAIKSSGTSAPEASRNLAILQTAIYDAVNGIDGNYTSFRAGGTGISGSSIEAAAAAAANSVMQSLYPSLSGTFTSLYNDQISGLSDNQARSDGISWGQQVASSYLTWRSSDGAATAASEPYVVNGTGGHWQPTAPTYSANPLLPGWGDVTPFGMTSGSQFTTVGAGVISGPPTLSSVAYANDYNQVKDLGAARPRLLPDTSVDVTVDIAKFWADGTGSYTPPGHWNQIAQTILTAAGSDVRTKARVMAALSVAMADSGIATWDAMYRYDFWRPETAIAYGGDAFDDSYDNNPLTEGAAWTPLLTSPLYPEYVSGHSAFSSAAAMILAAYLGDQAFSVDGDTDGNGVADMTRSFNSLGEAADEAGMSRIYGGVNFNSANQDGQALGTTIAGWTISNYFLPVPEPSGALLALVASGLLSLQRRRRGAA